ncbi:death domain-containing protein 1 [Erpetoichthys calabaricus]|uniref:Death domain containing 1 n=1 Tax=Erpetoichthys calabaricus TaxID=27687 RepID=A0A8C4RQ85_ERPCA|nr:death domain-containing protein 1 [Erpetoichthys calabaricus]
MQESKHSMEHDKMSHLIQSIQLENNKLKTFFEDKEDQKRNESIKVTLQELISLMQEVNCASSENMVTAQNTLQITCKTLVAELDKQKPNQVEQNNSDNLFVKNLKEMHNFLNNIVEDLRSTINTMHKIKNNLDNAEALTKPVWNGSNQHCTLTGNGSKTEPQDNAFNHADNKEDQCQPNAEILLPANTPEHKLLLPEEKNIPDENSSEKLIKHDTITDIKCGNEALKNEQKSVNGDNSESHPSVNNLKPVGPEKSGKECKPNMAEGKEKVGMQSKEGNNMLQKTDIIIPQNISLKTELVNSKNNNEFPEYHNAAWNCEVENQEDLAGTSKPIPFTELKDQHTMQSVCYIAAPYLVVQRLTSRIVNNLSSLAVMDSEELVSDIISIQYPGSKFKIPFPLSISIPFTARYRGNYRDIMVKIFEDGMHASYITPSIFEGTRGSQKGSFAEFKVYKFAIFSVVSCLRKENFTVPRKGLSMKLSMDPRIALDYPPGSFHTPVFVQSMVQPIDASILSTLKARSDEYHAVVSTSPLLHILHPSTQTFWKSVTFTLPCPPNPEKKKKGDESDSVRPASAVLPKNTPIHRQRAASATVKNSRDSSKEHLILAGYKHKEEQWIVMEHITVKNLQNGLVSFEIAEHVERVIVFRLMSSIKNSLLTEITLKLEEAIVNTLINVVLYRKKEDPNNAVVLAVPNKDLRWELMKLRDEGYSSPPDPSDEISIKEGEQVLLHFVGNISAIGEDNNPIIFKKLTFHCQRKNQMNLYLKELDEFGNYSSPHYKGTVLVYKLTKEDIKKFGDKCTSALENVNQNPSCKLALTLPKRERIISRPASAKSTLTDPSEPLSDALLHWLSGELSEEDAAVLVTCLRIRRSSIQLVKLKVPDNLTDQIYELLAIWRKSLPKCADKINLLSRNLSKCGRDDLVKDLQLKDRINRFSNQEE